MKFHHLLLILFFFLATTFDTRGDFDGGFEVELIHRDSPLSPLFNHSSTDENRERAAATRSLSHFHRLMTATTGENVVSIVNMGDGGGEFMMELQIGTPPITTHAIMDTGSDLLWIQCPPCLTCFPQHGALFDPTKSSTYHTVPCSSPLCHTIRPAGQDKSSINCTTPSEACKYTYGYADGSSSSGFLATETLTFQTLKRVHLMAADFVFGCGDDNKVSFTGGGAGIIGLGAGSLSLISQLKVERRFSYCLPKSAHIPTKFKFGVSASFPAGKVVSAPLILDEMNPTFYPVKLEGITVGGRTIASKPVASGKGNTIMDSGTTLNYLEPELYTNVVAAMKQVIGLPTVQDPSFTYGVCYPTNTLRKISVPTLLYHFTGADVELQNFNIFTSLGEITCLSMAASLQEGFNIYGNVAQKNFQIEYNLENKVVSFAPTECSAGGSAQIFSLFSSSRCCVLVFILVTI